METDDIDIDNGVPENGKKGHFLFETFDEYILLVKLNECRHL